MKKTRIIAAAVFIMTMLFAIPFTAKAATVGETVSQETAAELKAIDYGTNETIAKLLAAVYTPKEILDKKRRLLSGRGRILQTSRMIKLKKNSIRII